ncbi:MAG: helix-turn-helix domain-containing protein [Firmicutes bacterium]|nr:helix-turn-helix domain-containing protein [Bacillota bacterium]
MDRQQVASALRQARHNAGMTCQEVADKIGSSRGAVTAWEHCNGQPDISTLIRLCELYKLSGIDELLGFNKNYPTADKSAMNSLVSNILKDDEIKLLNNYRQLADDGKQTLYNVSQMGINQPTSKNERLISRREIEDALALAFGSTTSNSENNIKVFNQNVLTEYIKNVATKATPAIVGQAIVGRTITGQANPFDVENCKNFENIVAPHIPPSVSFAIRIMDDSMQPQLNYGDIVFVEKKSNVAVGEIGIFIVNGEVLCKQIVYRDNIQYLQSFNSNYSIIPFTSNSIKTIGRVIDKIHK